MKDFSVVDHYSAGFFERMRELECGAEYGMTLEEAYRFEAELALDQVEWRDGGHLLDVACGTGRHAFLVSDLLEHRVAIRGIDVAPPLIDEACARLRSRREGGVHEDVVLAVGDVLDLDDALAAWPGFAPVDAITCLGDSFGYHSNAVSRWMLAGFFDALRPGGRLILQARARALEPDARPTSHDYRVERRVIDGAEREVCVDPVRGDALFEYDIDCPHPDPDDPRGYVTFVDDGVRIYRDRDQLEYGAFIRGYIDPEGRQHTLPPLRMVRSYVAEKPFGGLRLILEEIGFDDVRLVEGKRLGTRRNLAVVARRPYSR